MRYISAAHTDVGIKKKNNQDSLCLKIAKTRFGEVCLAVMCDGMGGLQKGELASATVIRRFSKWFEEELPGMLANRQFSMDMVKSSWDKIINEQNDIVYRFGVNENIQLGTTLTALLIVNDTYITAQLGDSRAYCIDGKLNQLTKDQSVVARDVELKRITEAQAKTDPRRNVLLQCLGALKNIQTEYTVGRVSPGRAYLLCSDGFHHELADEEIVGLLSPTLMKSEEDIKRALISVVNLDKKRGETDNITVIYIKTL